MDEWEEESPVQAPPQYQPSSARGGGGHDGNNTRYNSRSYDNSNRRENRDRLNNDRGGGGGGGNRYSEPGERTNRYQSGQHDRNNRFQDQSERGSRHQDQNDRGSRYNDQSDRGSRYNDQSDRGNRYQGQGDRNNRYQDNGERENRNQERRPYGEQREASDQYSQNKRPYRNDNYECSESMEVDPNHIKFIIGKGGSKIREIESTCGVKLQIDKNDNNVKIAGATMEDVNKAIEIVKEVTSMADSRGGGNKYSASFDNAMRKSYNQDNEDEGLNLNKSGPIDWNKVNENFEKNKNLRWAGLPELKKDFYEEDPVIANLTAEQIEQIRKEKNNIMVSRVFLDETKDSNIPNPILEFEQCFRKYPDLLNELTKQKFTTPSPIQSQAWPILLKGEDLIGIAQTGTGKTLAFILPAMIHIINQPIPRSERTGPNVLVLAPTRELAIQIQQEVQKYQFRDITAVCIYGGGDRKEQINKVEKGVDIIIATPGRLNDLIEAKVIDISSITYIVLDEADRMLDMGFEPQIRKTLIDIRPDRQSVMTSATWPSAIRRLAQSYMNNPIQVCVGSLNLTAVHSVSQVIEIMDEEEKFYNIKKFVANLKPTDKVIIFCGKKDRCDDMASDFILDGINNQCIHGNREQVDREQALKDIKNGKVQILIATDVASRGIDIDDITHVINYDFPRNIEEYVHRVGRTGRAGRTGTSISYVTRNEWGIASELIPILTEAGEMVPIELHDMAERFEKMKQRRAAEGGSFGRGGGGRGGGGRGGGGGGGGFRRN